MTAAAEGGVGILPFVGVTFVMAAGAALLLGPFLLPVLREWKIGQWVRDQGPKRHLAKAGTPTMGGLLILGGLLVALVPTRVIFNPGVVNALILIGGFAALGFADDFIKVVLKRPLGLRARYKIAGQLALAILEASRLAQGVGPEGQAGTVVSIPLFGLFDFGQLYIPLATLVIIGTANAANLTDGLDGLLAGTTVIAGVAYTLISLASGHEEMAVLAASLAGASLGFLRYNCHPARVFMGDTGSLAIGGAMAALALFTRSELILPLVAGVWVFEALSVIVQVAAFRLLKRRVLRMSPLHHHFELGGWSEWRVVLTFWFAAAVFAAAGVLLYEFA